MRRRAEGPGPWRHLVAVAALTLVLPACAPGPPPGASAPGRVGIPGPGRMEAPPVELTYLGVTGWRIDTGETVILSAPLLTRPSIQEVGLGVALRPDSAAILDALEELDPGPLHETRAILVGHGHYDHLLDVPWIAARLAPSAVVMVNGTGRRQLLPFQESLGLDPDRIMDATEEAAERSAAGRWIRVAPDVRILPVRSDHAPHFAGRTLYSGVRRSPMPRVPGPAQEWLDGESLAWLVDVLAGDGEVRLRIYLQDAIPREPAGRLPPRDVLGDDVPVDLALLVPAAYAEATWHPEALVEHLRPAAVIVHHWEDFFAPVGSDHQPVVFTDLGDFLRRLRRVMPCDDCVHLPRPGTTLVVGDPEARQVPGGGPPSQSR